MRRLSLLVAVFAIGGCDKQPDFDSRYERAAQDIEARAKAMDADIAEADPREAASGQGSSAD